ncbi:MAG: hypothetical protein MZV64_60135 [Ignavibacteriales bacterium]|nr:hypothetical protein [Ignavibacteriales bacterium]
MQATMSKTRMKPLTNSAVDARERFIVLTRMATDSIVGSKSPKRDIFIWFPT